MLITYEYVRDAVGDKEYLFKPDTLYVLKEAEDYKRL